MEYMIGNKGHTVWGILIGLVLPFSILMLIYSLFYFNEMPMSDSLMSNVAIFGIAANMIPTKYYSKRKRDYTARGVMAITMVLVLHWVIQFMLD